MAADAAALEPDRPSSIVVLANQDAAASVAATARSGREIDDQAAEADGVVVGHSGLIGEGDELIALGGADFSEGRPGELWSLGEAVVEAIEVDGLQPGVGRIDLGNVLQAISAMRRSWKVPPWRSMRPFPWGENEGMVSVPSS
jgi:hypothetical protein